MTPAGDELVRKVVRGFALDPGALPQTVRLPDHGAKAPRAAIAALAFATLVLGGAWLDAREPTLVPFLGALVILWRLAWKGRRQRLALPSFVFSEDGVTIGTPENNWRAPWSEFDAVRARTLYDPPQGKWRGRPWWVIKAVHRDPDRTVPLRVHVVDKVAYNSGIRLPPELDGEDLALLRIYSDLTGLPARATSLVAESERPEAYRMNAEPAREAALANGGRDPSGSRER